MRMPFYIDVANKRILIIGGGSEGAKRATKYAEAGAQVTVLAKHFDADLRLAVTRGAINTVKADVSDTGLVEKLISDSDIVIVALDTTEYNDALVAMGQRAHKFVNLTNDAAATEVIVPVENEVHGIRLAATSEGKSVHVAREALQRAARFLEEQRDLWLLFELMQELRQKLKTRGVPLEARMRIYPAVYWDPSLREQAERQNINGAREAMHAVVDRLVATPRGSEG
jgi:precorrin-2 dehydrogenase/sirohydrochlorin ferrochelatase